ncbi:hypothetical protein [Actinoplanes teichomyceticus]|uniref:Uncharacterized protein n=1 Tax=Actinoplanes teichomyceticus TaxID=1867 RepID=A0A561VM40_ACTTI|nr:hypothetical protein [Actinoplanes teichomyceticus]TWG12657.1 hypothetical protein FHX34_105524 [Actinoplanes teichomyceticus]GIF13389.1 hypothetical protein Ate01nite_34210 [Actinoplanes teichomyceticus]
MSTPESSARWYRNRFVWVAVVLLAAAAAVLALRDPAGPAAPATGPAAPADLQGQITARMRTALEQSDPEQHQHAGHQAQPATGADAARPEVICGVRVYGYEPAGATALTEVRTVYGFHLCGVAERKRPWDVADKLAGPVILDMSTDPPGIRVVEATAEVRFVDRLHQMFPDRYAQLAMREALTESEMTDLRRRYDSAAQV